MKIHDAAAQGLVIGELSETLTMETMERGRTIDPSVELAGRLMLGASVLLSEDAYLGGSVSVGRAARIQAGVFLGSLVQVGPEAVIGQRVTIFRQATIGRNATIQSDVIVAPETSIPDCAQIGEGRIIPTQRAIMTLSPVGAHHRVVTIHGGPEGPEYSAGCQYSDSWQEFWDRIVYATDTTTESARHYRSLKRTFLALGVTTQRAYDAAVQRGSIDRLRDMAEQVRAKMRVRVPADDIGDETA